MEEALLSFLLWTSRIEGISDVPTSVPKEWISENKWVENKDESQSLSSNRSPLLFEARSDELLNACHTEKSGYIKFPVVLYAAQEVLLDNSKRIRFGDPTMKRANFTYSAPVLDCRSIIDVKSISWRVYGYSKYFSRVSHYPVYVRTKPLTALFGETLYVGSSIGIFVLWIFALSVLYKKEALNLVVALSASMIGLSVYLFCCIGPAFEVNLPMLLVHRIGDVALVLGIFFIVSCFWIERLIPNKLYLSHGIFTLISLPFLLFGSTGDTVQFGTSIPMPTTMISFLVAAVSLSRKFLRNPDIESALTFLFSAIFAGVVINDIMVATGSSSGFTFMSVGVLFAFLILLLAVNQRIAATYRERDYLRSNLEHEVERKTYELKSKTAELESAMKDLRHTQAELIHSAKLASLGTLSAGIAHEINNSVNFVSGAISPLEKIVMKLQDVSARDYEIATKLLKSIKDGISITVEIVKSLRQFTGLNQAKLKDVELTEVVKSVMTILRPKLKEKFHVKVDVPENLTLYGDVVGINQILMNLFTNAIDAMPSGGEIRVRGFQDQAKTTIEVSDTGEGIPEDIQNRIFDPFFTTKEVGQGTGLGLYIIGREMERHKGHIRLQSKVKEGTTFVLEFPRPKEEGRVA